MSALKKIESFLTSVEWNDYKRNRIKQILEEASVKTVIKSIEVVKEVEKVIRINPRVSKREWHPNRLDPAADEICEQFNVTRDFIKSKSQKAENVLVRKAFYIKAYDDYGATYSEIGRYVGKGHDAVMHLMGRLKKKTVNTKKK